MKAILVFDEMPNSCEKCEVRCDGYTAKEYKECVEKGIKRPSWCPLKPMLEEKMADAIPISFLKDRIAFNFSWGCYGYAKGLQSAIDEWEKQNDKQGTPDHC